MQTMSKVPSRLGDETPEFGIITCLANNGQQLIVTCPFLRDSDREFVVDFVPLPSRLDGEFELSSVIGRWGLVSLNSGPPYKFYVLSETEKHPYPTKLVNDFPQILVTCIYSSFMTRRNGYGTWFCVGLKDQVHDVNGVMKDASLLRSRLVSDHRWSFWVTREYHPFKRYRWIISTTQNPTAVATNTEINMKSHRAKEKKKMASGERRRISQATRVLTDNGRPGRAKGCVKLRAGMSCPLMIGIVTSPPRRRLCTVTCLSRDGAKKVKVYIGPRINDRFRSCYPCGHGRWRLSISKLRVLFLNWPPWIEHRCGGVLELEVLLMYTASFQNVTPCKKDPSTGYGLLRVPLVPTRGLFPITRILRIVNIFMDQSNGRDLKPDCRVGISNADRFGGSSLSEYETALEDCASCDGFVSCDEMDPPKLQKNINRDASYVDSGSSDEDDSKFTLNIISDKFSNLL